MTLRQRLGLCLLALCPLPLFAQSEADIAKFGVTVPTTGIVPTIVEGQELSALDRDFSSNATAISVDLRSRFTLAGALGGGRSFVQFRTPLGIFNTEMLADGTDEGAADLDPHISVNNFRSYLATDSTAASARSGTYDGTFVHRAANLGNSAAPKRILQGGGYRVGATGVTSIPRKAAIVREFRYANTRGTLAMARTSVPDSATSEWFFNLDDNTSVFNAGAPDKPAENNTYAVFARVIGSGMSVVDRIYALPTIPDSNDVIQILWAAPLRNWSSGQSILVNNLVYTDAVRTVPLQPADTGKGGSVLTYSVTNDNPSAATASVSPAGRLVVTKGKKGGRALIVVRASEAGGAATTSTLTVTHDGPPIVVKQLPATTTAALGTTVNLAADITAWPLNIRWQFRPTAQADWTDIPADDARFTGVTTEYLAIKLSGADPAAIAQAFALNNHQFRFRLTNNHGGTPRVAEGKPTTLRITTTLAFAGKLAAATTVPLGNTFTLSAPAATGTYPAPTYEWQRQAPGAAPGVWETLVNSAAAVAASGGNPAVPAVASPYSGVSTATLTIRLNGPETPATNSTAISTLATLTLHQSKYRCVIRHDRGAGPLEAANAPTTLRITTVPVGLATQPAKLVYGLLSHVADAVPTTRISIAAKPAAANTPVTYKWQARAPGSAPEAWVDLVNHVAPTAASGSTPASPGVPTAYLGVTTATLTIRFPSDKNTSSGFGLLLDGTEYRCVLRNSLATAPAPFGPAAGQAISATSTLRVVAGTVSLATHENFRLPGLPASGEAVSFTSTGLPKGLSIDAATGFISGTPDAKAKPGLYKVVVTVREGSLTVSLTYYIELLPLTGNSSGSYEALLSPADLPPVAKLLLTISANGTLTGTLTTAAEKSALALKGAVVRDATTGVVSFPAPVVIARPGAPAGRAYVLTDLSVATNGRIEVKLHTRESSSAPLVQLAVADSIIVANKETGNPGIRLSTYSKTAPAPWANVNSYNLAITTPALLDPEGGDVRPFPAGSGYAQAPVSADGKLALRGKLADGDKITASLSGGIDSSFRLFLRPYAATPGGFVSAELPLTYPSIFYQRHSVFGDAGKDAYWTKPASVAKTPNYAGGFGPLAVQVRLEPWFPSSFADFGFEATSDTSKGKTKLVLSGADLGASTASLPASLSITYAVPNATFVDFVGANPSKFTGKLNTNTGFFSGSFQLTDPGQTRARKVAFEGTLLMAEDLVGGTVTAEGFTIVPALSGASVTTPASGRIQFLDPRTPPAPPAD